MSDAYLPALTIVILGAVVFVVETVFALRERKQSRRDQQRTT
ncbi:MAG TPA: hypothetical protein VGY99_12430 [Candidatus Binataceae bacterium]|jgi:hypothetical protein|nr:hypothetical protein [Candidatus Binataceae bacterium]